MITRTKILISSIVVLTLATAVATPFVVYLKILPKLVSNPKIINCAEKSVKKYVNIDVEIKNPYLKTSMTPEIFFGLDGITASKDGKKMLEVQKLDTAFSFKDIFNKHIVVEKVGLDYVFADVNKIMSSLPKQKEEKKHESDWDIDFYDSVLSLKKSLILYTLEPNVNVKVQANNLNIDNTQKVKRYVHFDIDTEVAKAGKMLHFAIADKNSVVIQNKRLYVNDCVLDINRSNVHINATASRKEGFNVDLSSRKFGVRDVTAIVDSNIIINNGSEILSYFKDMDGNFDFDINLKKNDISGKVKLNNLKLQIVPVNNLPLTLTGGEVLLSKKDIKFKDFLGYHGRQAVNKVKINGVIKDYTNSCDTDVTIDTSLRNEFAKDYLSKIVGFPMQIVGKAGSRILVKSIFNKIDVTVMSKIAKGDDILVDGTSFSPVAYDRAVKADMHFEDNILNIKNIDYYIAQVINKQSKIKPVLSLSGNVDCSRPLPVVMDFGFNVPRPLPSEFLNLFVGQKLFRGGKFSGELRVLNNGPYPVLKGHMTAEKIMVPSQRFLVEEGELSTDPNGIYINSKGRFRRSHYDLKGTFANAIKYPIVVKDVDFGMDSIDVERMMQAFNEQNTSAIEKKEITNVEYDDNDDTVVFDVNNLIVEKCILRLKEGKYKNIEFGNIVANLTLDKNNVLKLESNKFDIAEGISTLKVNCDLKKHLYAIRLGIKDVNSSLMSESLLNLPREISGKASGLIELNTDESLKLNGSIKFLVKDGVIQKIGLVEYVLKFAALFRNPLVMISPSTLSDMITIPDGKFEKITGDMRLKNNVVEMMKIKSYSPQLSAFIVGRYNLENSDAILRIYTKFSNKNKGVAGFLRNISLNSLANRIPLSSRNDIQYYSSELEQLPAIEADEKDCQIFLTKVDGDVEHNNFISSLKKIK